MATFPSKPIDLERSELRYIFYAHDQDNLIQEFLDLGFEVLIYKDTPLTRTVYFGSKFGMKPGLSVKARIYSADPIDNVFPITKDTEFNLLELKSTVGREDAVVRSLMSDESQPVTKNVIFNIQRASEDGLLRDSSLKVKSRLKKHDLSYEKVQSKLKLEEIILLLTTPSGLDHNLSSEVQQILNSRIRPLYRNTLIPHVMTQYARIHLIPKPEFQTWKNFIRITIDPGVEFYNITLDHPGQFVEDPSGLAEFILRERHSRLEFKIDPHAFVAEAKLAKNISQILRNYGCIASLSKKWTGVTLVSERYIGKQAFWREPLIQNLSGFFPVHRSWYAYGGIIIVFHSLIKQSKVFSTYEEEDNFRVLVKNQNFVIGYLGIPTPSIVMTIEGSHVMYQLTPHSYPFRLTSQTPEFYIQKEFNTPVRSTFISSKKELDQIIHSSFQIDRYSYFRSYGFLVVSNSSKRIYKLTIERKTDVRGQKMSSEFYCKLRYVGTRDGLYNANEQEILNELSQFYEEFWPIMMHPIDQIEVERFGIVEEDENDIYFD